MQALARNAPRQQERLPSIQPQGSGVDSRPEAALQRAGEGWPRRRLRQAPQGHAAVLVAHGQLLAAG